MGRGVDRAVQHQQLVPQGEVLQHQVSTRVKSGGQASQDRENEGRHGLAGYVDSANQHRLRVPMDFCEPQLRNPTLVIFIRSSGW
jgi:hypothetical protein